MGNIDVLREHWKSEVDRLHLENVDALKYAAGQRGVAGEAWIEEQVTKLDKQKQHLHEVLEAASGLAFRSTEIVLNLGSLIPQDWYLSPVGYRMVGLMRMELTDSGDRRT